MVSIFEPNYFHVNIILIKLFFLTDKGRVQFFVHIARKQEDNRKWQSRMQYLRHIW